VPLALPNPESFPFLTQFLYMMQRLASQAAKVHGLCQPARAGIIHTSTDKA
jgi:hypothetical protein